jgi:hypothetical protein
MLDFSGSRTTQWTASRKQRPFAEGFVNAPNRPIAGFRERPATDGEPCSATVGAMGAVSEPVLRVSLVWMTALATMSGESCVVRMERQRESKDSARLLQGPLEGLSREKKSADARVYPGGHNG